MAVTSTGCIESIRFSDGCLMNLERHNQRMNQARKQLYGAIDFIRLEELIQIPDLLPTQVYKCRITYKSSIEAVEWEVYKPREIWSVQVVRHDSIAYSFKYKNREDLDQLFKQKKNKDEILIVRKGRVTDTYVCNVALRAGETWYTPAEPLLCGTQRERLLHEKKIEPASILISDLKCFSEIRLFNALIPWEEAITLPVSQIYH